MTMNPITKNVVFNMHQASLLLSGGSVLAGLAASVLRGGVVLFPAVMTMLCALLFQVSANLYYGYRKVKFVKRTGQLERSAMDTAAHNIMKSLSNVFAILAITTALPLFMRLKWISLIYLAVILVLVYFHFGGPRPLVRTRWSVLVTFFLFGPLAVSGTALIQNRLSTDWNPIIVYSIISGLMAANAHLSLQYVRRNDDVRDGMTSLLASRGTDIVRYLFVINVLIVSALLIFCSGDFGFDSRWVSIAVVAWLLVTTAFEFKLMRNETSMEVAMKIRLIAISQYVSAMIALLCIVLYSMDYYWITFFTIK